MKAKNIFISAFIFVMAALLVTPLMAQNTTYVDPDVEEYHELAEGRNALLINAAKAGKLWKVKFFLSSAGVRVNTVDSKGKTALMYAAQNGHIRVVDRLLEENTIDVNIQDDEDKTALMYAVQNGQTIVVDRLLKEKNIEVDAQDNEGVTALMYAVININKDIVEMLKDKADKTLTAKNGYTAYDYAKRQYALLQTVEARTREQIADKDRTLKETKEIMDWINPIKIDNEQIQDHKKEENISIGVRAELLKKVPEVQQPAR